jgi:hypothetical protein
VLGAHLQLHARNRGGLPRNKRRLAIVDDPILLSHWVARVHCFFRVQSERRVRETLFRKQVHTVAHDLVATVPESARRSEQGPEPLRTHHLPKVYSLTAGCQLLLQRRHAHAGLNVDALRKQPMLDHLLLQRACPDRFVLFSGKLVGHLAFLVEDKHVACRTEQVARVSGVVLMVLVIVLDNRMRSSGIS